MSCCDAVGRACFATLFFAHKFLYIVATLVVLGTNIAYIYEYMSTVSADDFFSKNQFPHCMGLFLGFLFRLSGVLSASKEKVSLTYTYILFLVLIMLMSTAYNEMFYLYLLTAVMAIIFVVMVKYRRACARRDQRRARQPSAAAVTAAARAQCVLSRGCAFGRTGVSGARRNDELITVALPSEQSSPELAPSAPPYDDPCHVPIDPFYHGQPQQQQHHHHTPPPSYDELYEKK